MHYATHCGYRYVVDGPEKFSMAKLLEHPALPSPSPLPEGIAQLADQ